MCISNKLLWRKNKANRQENTKEGCPVCGEDDDWKHVMLCEKNKENRAEYTKVLKKKLKEVEE